MTDNPYQTPTQSVDRSKNRGHRSGTGNFTISESLSEAWSATTGNFGLIIGAGFVSMVLMFLSAITIIGYFVVVPVLLWGMTRFAINLVDGNAQFNDIFSGFTGYGSKLGRSLGLVLMIAVLGLIGNIPYYIGLGLESDMIMILGSLFNIVFSLVVMVRTYFAMLYMVDQDMGAMEAIQASMKASGPLWGKTIGLAIVSGIVGMLGVLALVVGLLISIPVSYLMWVSAYRQMEGTENTSSQGRQVESY